MSAGPQEEFLTVDEVAAALKVNHQTVRNWITAGKLPAVHIGRRVRVRKSDFEHVLVAGAPHFKPGPRKTREPSQAFWDGELVTEAMAPPLDGAQLPDSSSGSGLSPG
jgi:excisionase family DNA binding protein